MELTKIAGLCGLISPIIALILIGAAISMAPAFSWAGSCLSDLGAAAETSLLFNAGVLVAGVLALVFAAGFYKSGLLDTRAGRAGSILLILAAISLILIGLLPTTMGPVHFYVSLAFFALSPLSVLIIGLVLRKSDRDLGLLAIILGIIGFYSISILTGVNCAANETVAIIPLALFAGVFGVKMFREEGPPKQSLESLPSL
jgi:hypothetical membrane protein